jgi:hypothetical protein
LLAGEFAGARVALSCSYSGLFLSLFPYDQFSKCFSHVADLSSFELASAKLGCNRCRAHKVLVVFRIAKPSQPATYIEGVCNMLKHVGEAGRAGPCCAWTAPCCRSRC